MTPLGTFGRRTQVHQAFKTLIPSFTPMSGGLRGVCLKVWWVSTCFFWISHWWISGFHLLNLYNLSNFSQVFLGRIFFFTSSRHPKVCSTRKPHLGCVGRLTVWPCFCACGSWGKSMSTTKSLFQACKKWLGENSEWNLEHFEIWYQVQGASKTKGKWYLGMLRWQAWIFPLRENTTTMVALAEQHILHYEQNVNIPTPPHSMYGVAATRCASEHCYTVRQHKLAPSAVKKSCSNFAISLYYYTCFIKATQLQKVRLSQYTLALQLTWWALPIHKMSQEERDLIVTRDEPPGPKTGTKDRLWCQFQDFDFLLLGGSLGGGFKYFYFHRYLGKSSNLNHVFQMGWNHQPVLL